MHKGPKTILLALFLSSTINLISAALPQYELIQLNLPASQSSFATALNDRNELVGYTLSNNVQIGFLFKSQSQTITLLPAFEGQSHPYAINNLGVIVGSATTNGLTRAWKFANDLNTDLAPLATNTTLATSINDLGDIVGLVVPPFPADYPFAALFTNTVQRLSGDYGWDASGLLPPPPDANISMVNNKQFAVGRHFGGATLWTNLSTTDRRPISMRPSEDSVFIRTDALGLNSSNYAVGSFRSRYSVAQAGLWISNDWTALPSSLRANATARSINDNGIIVGSQTEQPPYGAPVDIFGAPITNPPPSALIWKNNAGADLNSFVTLPPDARVTEAIAINNAGWIAANLTQTGLVRAVLLKPISDNPIPTLKIAGLTNTVYSTNTFQITVDTTYETNQTRQVQYTLFKHTRFLRPVSFYQSQDFSTDPVQTNIATGANLSTTFNNLPAGAYVLNAVVSDTNGLILYSLPQRFIVAGDATLLAPFPPANNELSIGLQTSVGREYLLQVSTNLLDWQTLTNPPAPGGLFRVPFTTDRSFYRALVNRESPDIYPIAPIFPSAPPSLAFGYLSLGTIQLTFSTTTFQGTTADYGPLSGTYTYQPSGQTATLDALDPADPPLRLHLNLTFTTPFTTPFGGRDGTYTGTLSIQGSPTITLTGRFSF